MLRPPLTVTARFTLVPEGRLSSKRAESTSSGHVSGLTPGVPAPDVADAGRTGATLSCSRRSSPAAE